MRTYKENIIELVDGESVVVRVKGLNPVQLKITAEEWSDYEGEPSGLVLVPFGKVRAYGEQVYAHELEIIPAGELKLKESDLPHCEQCGKTVTDGMPIQWAPYCSEQCRNAAVESIVKERTEQINRGSSSLT
jgi:endogenous inhibitor of DNA gyrase (YacG/DUF329 family)